MSETSIPAAVSSPSWRSLVAIGSITVLPLGALHAVLGVVGSVGALVVIVWDRRHGVVDPTHRVAIFTLVLAVVSLARLPFTIWAVVGVLVVSSRWMPWLVPSGGWLPRGHADGFVAWFGVAVVAIAGLGLWAWVSWTRDFDATTDYLVDVARTTPGWAIVVFVVVFVVANAVSEEIAYRGLVQQAAADAWPPSIAIASQAVAFGALHVAGFPSGVVGVVLAGGYGLLLGIIRHRSRGLGAVIVVHMAADTTIAVLVLTMLVGR